MKVGGFITVRLGSSRLPRKAFLKVNGDEIISYLVRRIMFYCGNDMDLFICTTDLQEDNELDILADRFGIGVFHGNENNILKRHLECAEKNNVDFIVNIDGDDILCNPHYIKKIINSAEDKDFDVIKTNGLPFGTNSMGYYTLALRKTLSEVYHNVLETGWGNIITDTKINRVKVLQALSNEMLDNARLTLDYEEDFKVFEIILTDLMSTGVNVPQEDVITYLMSNPQVLKINMHLNDKYWENYRCLVDRDKLGRLSKN